MAESEERKKEGIKKKRENHGWWNKKETRLHKGQDKR
jgi:hypothetical protein